MQAHSSVSTPQLPRRLVGLGWPVSWECSGRYGGQVWACRALGCGLSLRSLWAGMAPALPEKPTGCSGAVAALHLLQKERAWPGFLGARPAGCRVQEDQRALWESLRRAWCLGLRELAGQSSQHCPPPHRPLSRDWTVMMKDTHESTLLCPPSQREAFS